MLVSETDLSNFLVRMLLFIKRRSVVRSVYILNSELLHGGMTTTECVIRNCHNLYTVPDMGVLIDGLIRHHIRYSATPIDSWSPNRHMFTPLAPLDASPRGSDAAIVIFDVHMLSTVLKLISGTGASKCPYDDACEAVTAQTAALTLNLFDQNPRLSHLIWTSPPKECIALKCTAHCEVISDMDSLRNSRGPMICHETLQKILTASDGVYYVRCYKTPVGPLHKAAYVLYISKTL